MGYRIRKEGDDGLATDLHLETNNVGFVGLPERENREVNNDIQRVSMEFSSA